MTLLAPLFAILGAVAALGVVALHLITTHEPPTLLLPTARFVPPSSARATSRSARPSDPWLLLLRTVIVLLLGLAFAGPVRTTRGPAVRTVVMVDASRAPAAMAEVRDSASRWLGDGASLVVFDSAARTLARDSLGGLIATTARPSLTAALLAARSAAIAVAPSADSVRLVLVSPLTADALDAATSPVRARWTGGIRHVPVAARVDSLGTDVRIHRARVSETELAWVRAGSRVLLAWPDTVVDPQPEGVTLEEGGSWVAPLGRRALDGSGRVIARWADGAPAAIERSEGTGCVRDIGIVLPPAGDLTLSPGYAALLKGLSGRCGGSAAMVADSALRRSLLGASTSAMATTLLRQEVEPDRTLALLLLTTALVLLVLEMIVRRRVTA